MQAVATALIKGKCYPQGSVLEAESDILAQTIIDTWEEVVC
jgi:hypothetical protein